MTPNPITSADGGWRVVFAFVAQWPTAAEFCVRSWRVMRFKSVVMLVVAAGMLIGCAHSPTTRRAAIVIRAVRPTGGTCYTPHPQPVWQFAVTNTGNCDLHWEGGVEDRGWTDRQYSVAGGHIDWPEGVLAPGEGLCTNMIVPAKGTAWRGFVEYYALPLTFKTKFRRYNDAWHSGS